MKTFEITFSMMQPDEESDTPLQIAEWFRTVLKSIKENDDLTDTQYKLNCVTETIPENEKGICAKSAAEILRKIEGKQLLMSIGKRPASRIIAIEESQECVILYNHIPEQRKGFSVLWPSYEGAK